ncbi:hypothetical protein FRC01_000080 [Tulasnella sp. 417]|nr:hypothetical protein FRC01_000080 [Tulasnella sp. 417]
MSPAEKLERIQTYAARIRTIRFDAFDSSFWKSNAVEAYSALVDGKLDQYIPMVSLPSGGLLPNLHTLKWRADESRTLAEATLRAVSYFLHSSLKHLYISGVFGRVIGLGQVVQYGSVQYGPFFQTLTTMENLKLKSLNLRMGQSTGALADEVIPCLRRHQNTLVHFSAWTPEFVSHFQTELYGLPHLRSLEVIVNHFPQAVGFIEGLADARPGMEVLNLSVSPISGRHEPQPLWSAVKRLRKLTKLHLKIPEVKNLQEEDARSMKEAWPALSCLYIMSSQGWSTPGFGCSQDFLSAITRHFSKSLRTLGLHFAPNIRSSASISPVRFEKLELLYIEAWSQPDDPEALARYLAQILPNGAILKGSWHQGWNQIVDILERERARDPVRATDPLKIPEILIRVLELADSRGRVAAACVCRRWSELALDLIWRDLKELAPYFNLLFLLKNIDESHLSAAEMLERIKSYGARIRSQRVDVLRSFFNALLDDSGAVELYRALYEGKLDQYLTTASLPTSGLFPNLRTLKWRTTSSKTSVDATIKAVSYFLNPSLKHLELSRIAGNAIAPFLQTLNAMDDLRLESLKWNIDVDTEGLLQAGDEVRLFFLQHQEHLRHFSTRDPVFVRHCQKEICGLSRLQSLKAVADDEIQAAGFVEGLADQAPEIEDLSLGVHLSERCSGWQGLWDALKRLRKLSTLHLRVSNIGELKEEDARSMSVAWPALSRLYVLQSHPTVAVFDPTFLPTPDSGLSLDFFNAIAQHFSQSLTTLALSLGPSRCSPLPINPVRFEKLQTLYIQSCFTPEDRETLQEYFTQVLPPSGSLIW